MKHSYIALLCIALFSCSKEYVTNEYYVNQEDVYNNKYYTTILTSQQEITEDIRPPYLKSGDSVAIFAASNKVTKAEMEAGKRVLESWGLKIREADNLYNVDGRYAGTVEERTDGLQSLIDNPNIHAIIAARGGYGSTQIIDKIDFTPLKNNPKWFVGYSDVTAFHIALNNMGIESIHGAMARNLSDEDSAETLRRALFGERKNLTIDTNNNCIEGEASGRLVGGNLSLIYSMGGTIFDLNAKNAILFIEDTGEANYAIDRMLTNLKLSGKLNAVKGIVVGDFTNMNQGSDLPIEQIIIDKVKDLGIPVMYGVKCGHDTKNLALYLGRPVTLKVTPSKATVIFDDEE